MNEQHMMLDSYLGFLELHEGLNPDLLQEALKLNSITKTYQKLQKTAAKNLKDYGVSVSKLESKGKAIGKNLHKYHEQGKSPKDTTKILNKQVAKIVIDNMQPVMKKVKASGEAIEHKSTGMKILIALIIYMILVVVQGMILVPLMITFGPVVAITITAILFAPITEEAAKLYFVSSGMPWIGTGVTFGIEAVTYILQIAAMGLSIPGAILLRAVALGMHFSTTFIQKLVVDQSPHQLDQSRYMFAAWIAGVGIHMTWNIFGMVYNKELISLLK